MSAPLLALLTISERPLLSIITQHLNHVRFSREYVKDR